MAQSESESESERRNPSAPRGRCSGAGAARSHCLRFHASLAKPPQTARGVDPQAVSVPDTTPAATLRFAWKSDAMAQGNTGWGAKRWSHRERASDVRLKRKRSQREKEQEQQT